MFNSLNEGYRALVIGSTGTIGAAFVGALQSDNRCTGVHTLSRQSLPPIDLDIESSMAAAAVALQTQAPFHLIVDATGALTIDGVGPEKNLAALSEARLMRSFQINAIGPALLFKHFYPLLATSGRSIYAKLSARVGSIGDNSKGGWYGYRASKAALNMMLQTAAIEAARRRPELVVAALQPGTVASALTSAFVDPSHCITPEQSVAGMLAALDGLPAKSGAHFVDYAGNSIEW